MVNTMTLTLDTEFEINGFKKLPNFLDMIKEFFSLKVFSKYIYTCFLDRAHLSKKNGWADENGEVYIIFTYEEMEKVFGRAQKTIRNYVNELVDNGLIKIKRQGQGNPNKIYVKGFIKQEVEEPQDESSNQVGQAQIELKEVENNKDHRFKDKLKTKKTQKKALPLSIEHANGESTSFDSDYSTSIKKVKSQINYDELIKDSEHVNLINSITNCVAGVMTDTRPVLWVNQQPMPKEKVVDVYSQLTQEHIKAVISSFLSITSPIGKKDQYLKSMLFNAIPDTRVQSTKQSSNAPYIQRNRFCNFKEEEWDFDELKRQEEEYIEWRLAEDRDADKSNPQKE